MSTIIEPKYSGDLRSLLHIPMVRQLIFLLGISASVALGIVLYMSIIEPIYQPLDYQVTPQNFAALVDTLEKANIKYKVNEQDGVVMIPAKDMQSARLKLSAAGVPRDDGFNYSFLNDQNSIGNSQFLENARYLRALESDLSKTISAIEGISSAKVHIAVPQNNIFADENNKPTASIMLSLNPGMTSDKEKIRAIVQIVAASVPGLDPKDVAITDQYGHYLSNALDTDAIYNAEQLSYQNNVQNYYEKRIESLIAPLVGNNKVSVRVYANIDFTQQEEAKEQYDPDKQAIVSDQEVNETSGSTGASGTPGSLSNTPPPGGEKKDAAAGGVQNTRTESTKNYETGKSVSYKKTNFAKILNLSAAVVVDNESIVDAKTNKTTSKPLDQEKINKINELVKATIGYQETRGDKVTIINSSFTTPEKIIETQSPLKVWDQPWFWDMVKKYSGMVLGFIFLAVLYKRMSGHLKEQQKRGGGHRAVTFEDQSEYNLSPEMLRLKQEQINRLKELVSREPSRVASVIKDWVGK
jgi:flagellar M-ring protein FliF